MSIMKRLKRDGIEARQLKWEKPLYYQNVKNCRPPQFSYQPPILFNIVGIQTAIVDPHNEVLWFWDKMKTNLPLLHIDAHSDMGTLTIPFTGNKENGEFKEYIREKVGIGSFIPVAMYEGLVSVSHYYNPFHPEEIRSYGKGARWNVTVSDLLTCKDLSKHNTDSSIDDVIKELNKGRRTPPRVDIDLDGLLGLTGRMNGEYRERLKNTLDILKHAPRPKQITIARSQTPRTYIAPEYVDRVLEEVVKKLFGVYGAHRQQN